jgi:hypothetical protein
MPDMLTAINDAKLMMQQQNDAMQAASGMLHAECLVQVLDNKAMQSMTQYDIEHHQ